MTLSKAVALGASFLGGDQKNAELALVPPKEPAHVQKLSEVVSSVNSEYPVFTTIQEKKSPLEVALSKGEIKLKELAPAQQTEERFILSALKFDINQIKDCPPALLKTVSFLEKALAVNGEILGHLDKELRDNETLVRIAVGQTAKAFAHASERLRDDRSFVDSVVRAEFKSESGRTYHMLNAQAFEFASAQIRNDKAFVIQLLEHNVSVYENASESVRSDRDIAKRSFAISGHGFRAAPESFRHDPELLKTAILRYFPQALNFTSEALRADESLNKLAAERCTRKEEFDALHKKYRTDDSFLRAVCLEHPSIYNVLPQHLKEDRTSALAYVVAHPFYKLPEKFASDLSFITDAVRRTPYLYKDLPLSFKTNEQVVLSAISTNASVIADLPDEVLENRSLLQQIAVTSLSSRSELTKRMGTLSDDVVLAYTRLEAAYKVLGLNSAPLKIEDSTIFRFDNSKAIVQGRYQVGAPEIKTELEKLLGKAYFQGLQDLRTATSRPTLIIMATADHNGALGQDNDLFVTRDNIDNLTIVGPVVYYEARGVGDVIDAFQTASFRGSSPVKRFYLSAHSSSSGMQFSADGYLLRSDTKNLIMGLRGTTAPNVEGIVTGCEMGKGAAGTPCIARTIHAAIPDAKLSFLKIKANVTIRATVENKVRSQFVHGPFTVEDKDILTLGPLVPYKFNIDEQSAEGRSIKRVLNEASKRGATFSQSKVKVYNPKTQTVVDNDGVQVNLLGENIGNAATNVRTAARAAEISAGQMILDVFSQEKNVELFKRWETTTPEELQDLKTEVRSVLAIEKPILITLIRGTNVTTFRISDKQQKSLAELVLIPDVSAESRILFSNLADDSLEK